MHNTSKSAVDGGCTVISDSPDTLKYLAGPIQNKESVFSAVTLIHFAAFESHFIFAGFSSRSRMTANNIIPCGWVY